jgi:hypothetical protein
MFRLRQALEHDGRRTPACRRSHAAAGTQERDGARCEFPPRDGPPSRRRGDDGAADVAISATISGLRWKRCRERFHSCMARACWGFQAPGRSCCAIASAYGTLMPENTTAAPRPRRFRGRSIIADWSGLFDLDQCTRAALTIYFRRR